MAIDPAKAYAKLNRFNVAERAVAIDRLAVELDAASIPHRALGVYGGQLHTYDENGLPVELPPEAAAIVAAHVPDPAPDYGADADDTTPQQIATRVAMLRQYIATQSPGPALQTGVIKILCWWALWQIRQTFRRPR